MGNVIIGVSVMAFFLAPAVIAFVLIVAFGFFLATYSMSIKRQSLSDALKWQREHYDLSWFRESDEKSFVVKSYDGYLLNVHMLVPDNISDKYVIISHGYTDNHFGSLKYAKMYLDLGFNVITYDLRGHGANEKTFTTYSIRESKDLWALIKEIRKRYIDIKVLGIHGESLGGATSIAVLKYKPEVDFVVDDCGFSEISSVLKAGLRDMHLPDWSFGLAAICAKIKYGYSYGQGRPIDALSENEIPILFIHGEKDDFIKPYHAYNMQKETKGYSEIYMIKGAGHAESILKEPEEYRGYVKGFIERVSGGSV